jgi:hypothetical protein
MKGMSLKSAKNHMEQDIITTDAPVPAQHQEGESGVKRICKKCLLRDMAEADKGMIEKYLAAIQNEDRVPKDEYERRLSICTTCDYLNSGTCAACGCYVELRAAGTVGRCPYKKW